MTTTRDNLSYAIQIKESYPDIQAPVNDIAACIEEVQGAGVPDSRIETMVSNMFLSDSSSRYNNISRAPAEDEILVYDISEEWKGLIKDST